MIKNNKAFSLIELFAMILITTILIYPLIQSLVKNIEINDMLQQRRSATSISGGTLSSIDKMNYSDIFTLLDTANGAGDYYVDLNLDSCSILPLTADENLCISQFSTVWNSLSLESTEYKVIIYNYYLDTTSYNSITTDTNLPIAVRNEILTTLTAEDTLTNESLLRATIWIEYYQDPPSTMTLSGLIIDD